MSRQQRDEMRIQQLMQEQLAGQGAGAARGATSSVPTTQAGPGTGRQGAPTPAAAPGRGRAPAVHKRFGYVKPRIVGDYIYEFLDALVADEKIIAITKVSTGQRVYRRVPRLEYEKLVAHEGIRGTVVGQSIVGSRAK